MAQSYVIELWGNKQFMGYAKSVSTYFNRVLSTPNMLEAKTYSSPDRAMSEIDLICKITHGGLAGAIKEKAV